MLAYHGKPELKKRLLVEIAKHRKADAIVQGSYGEENGQWKGCAIACSLRSLDKVKRKSRSEEYSGQHNRYPSELGIPEVLAHLEDRLFEGMTVELARKWPERFASAIRPGADLSLVWARFAHWMLIDETSGVIRHAKTKATRAAIIGVSRLYEREIAGDKPSKEEWKQARRNAAAAYSYAAAAYASAAAYAARAAADAYDAYADAAYAAAAAYSHAAAYSYAADAAASYARRSHFALMADKLVELLKASRPLPTVKR